MDLRTPLSAAVRSRRSALGLTQRELGQRAGVANATISKIEQRKLSPTIETLARLSLGLELELPEFLRLVSPTDEPAPPSYSVERGRWTDMRRALLSQILADLGDIPSASAVLGVPAQTLIEWLDPAHDPPRP